MRVDYLAASVSKTNPHQRFGPRPIGNNGPVLGRKHRKDFTKQGEYVTYLERKLEKGGKNGNKKRKNKKRSSKEKKKKEGGGFWDTLLSIGMNIIPKILPFIISPKHTVSVHSGLKGASTVPVPAASGTEYKTSSDPVIESMGPGRVRICHGSLAGSLVKVNPRTGQNYARGEVMFSLDITPAITPFLTRVCSYQHFKFQNLAFTIQPSVPTITAGRVMGCFLEDVDTTLPLNQGDSTIMAASSLGSALETDIWVPHTFVSSYHDSPWYYTSQSGTEPRTNKQGIFYIIACSEMSSNDIPDNIADVFVSYEMCAQSPILMPDPALGISTFLSNPADGSEGSGHVFGNGPALGKLVNTSETTGIGVNVPYAFSGTGFGTGVQGDSFQLPPGNYQAHFEAEGTGFSALGFTPKGNYVALEQLKASGASVTNMSTDTATDKVMDYFFSASGFNDPMSCLALTLTYTTLEHCEIRFSALGGRPVYMSPFTQLRNRLDKLIDKSIVGASTGSNAVTSSVSKTNVSTTSSSTSTAHRKQ